MPSRLASSYPDIQHALDAITPSKKLDVATRIVLTVPRANQAKAWIAWAHEQADLLDPLLQNLDEVKTLAVELESWFSSTSYGRRENNWWE